MVTRWQLGALTLSVALLGMLVAFGLWESAPWGGAAWAAYQNAYSRLAAGSDGVGAAAAPEIIQIEVPALNRVDRCTTCHVGVTNPNMADAPEPFRTHAPILDAHAPERFGCGICHGGAGRAVALPEAHGERTGGPERLLRGALLQARCYVCHGLDTLPPADTALVAEGIKLINAHKCLRCHQMDGAGGSEGPDLSTIAAQRDWVELYAHLVNPQALVPGSTMPAFGLSRDEATAITTFLLTRLDARMGVRDVAYMALQPVGAASGAPAAAQAGAPFAAGHTAEVSATCSIAPCGRAQGPMLPTVLRYTLAPMALPAPRYEGRALFEGLGCSLCHRVGLRGGEVGPALTHIGRVREADWLRRLLVEPEAVFPEGQMPAYALSETQLAVLIEYLLSLV